MKISHEIPKQLFSIHDEINDYPYILGHLLSQKYNFDKEYADFYREKLKGSEFSILDNSAYELGHSINSEILFQLGEEYSPSHIVLPDSYGNLHMTRKLVYNYVKLYARKSTPKFFAVLQGKTIEDYLDCYHFYSGFEEIDMIGVNAQVNRKEFLENLFLLGDVKKKIHLLGCYNPGEFLTYSDSMKSKIHSIDTSSPIINGWLGNRFEAGGYAGEKSKIKLADNLDIQLNEEQRVLVMYNIQMFKNYCK